MNKTDLLFFLPRQAWPFTKLPESVEADPSIYFLGTPLNWVLQTYLRLKAMGHPVRLTPDLPDSGIIITFSGLLPLDFLPSREQFLVSMSGDNSAHYFAQMRVVQNRTQTKLLGDSVHVPHWPQAGLIARNSMRGTKFERAAFFGDGQNLAVELQSAEWNRGLGELGLEWSVRDQHSASRMDYSDVDVMIAVRSFQKQGYVRKPASKLYNAWLAGVPAVLGAEFAYREEKNSDLDFIEVDSRSAAFQAIQRLKESPELRKRMVENGTKRAREVSVAGLTEKWWSVLGGKAVPQFETWRELPASERERFIVKRRFEKKLRGLRHRWLRLLGREQNSI